MKKDLNTPIWMFTAGELIELILKAFPTQQTVVNEERPKEKWLVYGMKGLAELFNCSVVTAGEIKRSGVIDKAISQFGRTIVVDAEKALELMRNRKVK